MRRWWLAALALPALACNAAGTLSLGTRATATPVVIVATPTPLPAEALQAVDVEEQVFIYLESHKRVGDQIQLTVVRGTETLTLTATLAERG